ncbi:(Fe-S)-binding protein [Aliagarivorans taiwanensis]|uniref:(Fe-S)-binding protein n=1 Tax=Aliagarivorans taiwanensis TaxID=561966 RepID=UPI000403B06F|nr:(Fe-S)-binding protein [Aliagarivorans taiwanensis]
MKTELDWSRYRDQGMGDAYADIPKQGGDFAKAVSVCINSGVCQTQRRGLMCPSYQVSGDKRLSPGGRVGLLKQWLNQPEPMPQTASADLQYALEYCVACKGCQRECESNLDMALIKAEYLGQLRRPWYKQLNPRHWLLAHLPKVLQRLPLLRPLIIWRNRSPWLAKLGQRLLAIPQALPLPVPNAETFKAQSSVYPADRVSGESARSVVLLLDSFTTLFNPQLADDAIRVLQAGGYQVHLVHPRSNPGELLDSGRSLLSQGYITAARRQANKMLQCLQPHIEAGRPIIGLEPADLLMLRDEYLALGLGEPALALAKQTWLMEEFISRELRNGRFRLDFQPQQATKPAQSLIVFGHCHQKATGAMKAMRRVLKQLPGVEFQFLESSCCGMAGTWGLELCHHSMSQRMAETSLLPGLAANPDATIISNGFGCSHQIYTLTGRTTLHLASLLAQRLIRS